MVYAISMANSEAHSSSLGMVCLCVAFPRRNPNSLLSPWNTLKNATAATASFDASEKTWISKCDAFSTESEQYIRGILTFSKA